MSILSNGRRVQYLCSAGKTVEQIYIGGKVAYRRNLFPDFDYDDGQLKITSRNGRLVFEGTTKGTSPIVAQQLFQPGTYRIESDRYQDHPAWRIGNIAVQPTCRFPPRYAGENTMTVTKPTLLTIATYTTISLSLGRHLPNRLSAIGGSWQHDGSHPRRAANQTRVYRRQACIPARQGAETAPARAESLLADDTVNTYAQWNDRLATLRRSLASHRNTRRKGGEFGRMVSDASRNVSIEYGNSRFADIHDPRRRQSNRGSRRRAMENTAGPRHSAIHLVRRTEWDRGRDSRPDHSARRLTSLPQGGGR